jgi:hypothetical protein
MRIENIKNADGLDVVVIYDDENDKATSMYKSEYDRRQAEAEHFTPSLTNAKEL